MHGLPIGIPAVPEVITKRIWDFVVQGIADAFKNHDKKDIARRIEALRASPNLPSLMMDAVQDGWQYWLTHSHEHAIVVAVRRDVQDHLPTLLGNKLLESLQRPITRHDVEEYLATWFVDLHSGATLGACRDAARDLLDRILQATLSAPPLHDLAEAVLQWDEAHRRPQPALGPRIAKVREGARDRARADGFSFVSSAHLMYGLASVQPPNAPQQILGAKGMGMSPEQILKAIPKLPLTGRHEDGQLNSSAEPEELAGIRTLLGEAQARAAEENAQVVDDGHLLRGILAIMADPYCTCSASLRLLFKEMNVDPVYWAKRLTEVYAWPTINNSIGILLSEYGI